MINIQEYVNDILLSCDVKPLPGSAVLITGATGLIGSCVVDTLYLLNQKYNLEYGIYASARNLNRLRDRFSYDKERSIRFVVQDVTSPLDENLKIDYIIHTASLADPVSYAEMPVETILTNILGHKSMLDYCRQHNKTRLVITSTFEVYGEGAGKAELKETFVGNLNFNILRSGYPESKRCSEVLARSYGEEYGVDYVIGRLSSVYGPTMSDGDSKAHAQFFRNALSGNDIVLKSPGTQKRSYTYVIDVVSALLFLCLNGESGETYNISNSNSVCTIAELASMIAGMTGHKIIYDLPTEIERKGFSTPKDTVLDCRKINNLGWRGRYDIEEGLSKSINILKNKIKET